MKKKLFNHMIGQKFKASYLFIGEIEVNTFHKGICDTTYIKDNILFYALSDYEHIIPGTSNLFINLARTQYTPNSGKKISEQYASLKYSFIKKYRAEVIEFCKLKGRELSTLELTVSEIKEIQNLYLQKLKNGYEIK